MYRISRIFLVALFVTVAMAQSPEPPLSDSRLSIHTLVREDIFAGYLSDDIERLARGEKSIQTLLEKRPNAKAELLAWQAGATLYRAVRAYENNRNDEFQQKYKLALDLFSQANQLGPKNGGVAAVTGGSYVVFGDRLPKEYRAAAWSQAYDSYQELWKQQGAAVDKLPCICGASFSAGWRNPHCAPGALKRPRSISIRYSPCSAILLTTLSPKNGRLIPNPPPIPASPA